MSVLHLEFEARILSVIAKAQLPDGKPINGASFGVAKSQIKRRLVELGVKKSEMSSACRVILSMNRRQLIVRQSYSQEWGFSSTEAAILRCRELKGKLKKAPADLHKLLDDTISDLKATPAFITA